MSKTVEELKKDALRIRKDLLKLCKVQTIHIGGDLSITDVMTVLWQYQMKYDPKDIHKEDRDRFVLSKGHASAVTSFNQALLGCYSEDDVINEYATDGGRFSMHSCNLVNPFVEVSTGSLGHGFPIACGIAEGLRRKKNFSSRVYTVLGDGECEEGSVWEAAMNAYHYGLGNLVIMIDNNNLSNDGFVNELTGLSDISKKFKAFNWNVVDIDGNDIEEIKNTFDNLPPADSKIPTAIICHTIKGKGVPFMENVPKWHAGKISEDQYEEAVRALDKAFEAGAI